MPYPVDHPLVEVQPQDGWNYVEQDGTVGTGPNVIAPVNVGVPGDQIAYTAVTVALPGSTPGRAVAVAADGTVLIAGGETGDKFLFDQWDDVLNAWAGQKEFEFTAPATPVTVANVEHAQQVTQPGVTPVASITVSNVEHAQQITQPTLTLFDTIPVDSVQHTQQITQPTLTPLGVVVPSSLTHAQQITQPAIFPFESVTVANVEHAQQVTQPTATPQLSVANVEHAQQITQPTLTLFDSITVSSLAHTQRVTQTTVAAPDVVTPASLAHAQTISVVTLTAQLNADNLQHSSQITQPSLVVKLQAANLEHAMQITSPGIAQNLPPELSVPNNLTLFYDDPPGTGVPQSDPIFQAWITSATAFDNEDGDLTSSITTNENTLTYPLTAANTPQTVTWSVTDGVGQTVEESRNVSALVREEAELGGGTGLNLSLSLEL